MSPFVSQAQRAKFHADPKLKKFIPEFEAATGKKKLPKHVKPNKKKKKAKWPATAKSMSSQSVAIAEKARQKFLMNQDYAVYQGKKK